VPVYELSQLSSFESSLKFSLDDLANIGIRIWVQPPKNRSSIPDNTKIFVFDEAWRPHLNPIQLSIQWALLSLNQEFRQPDYTADYSSPTTTEDECVWSYAFVPLDFFKACRCTQHRFVTFITKQM